MAKKRNDEREEQRRSRKEVLLARRRRRQTRQIRIAVGGVVGLLILILGFAVVNEYIIRPNRPVATVNERKITLREWQDRVRYTRAQFIMGLEQQLDTFQDVSLVQQFSQRQIELLLQPELLGELVLEQMVDEIILRQAASVRGIEVSEEEVDEAIGEQFNFFGGDSPTPMPTPTATIMPTPSLTPIPTEVITEVVPTEVPLPTPTPGPTSPPPPTPTPVSEEAFQQDFGEMLARLRGMGVSEETYRDVIRAQLYREKLADALGEEVELPDEAEQASVSILSFDTEEAAEAALSEIAEEDFLTVWNRIRSAPQDAEENAGSASEVLWRTQEQLEQQFGPTVAEIAFELPLHTPSEIIAQEEQANAEADEDLPTRYFIIQVSGREVRPLSRATVENQKQELVTTLISERRDGSADVEISNFWRTRVPNQPILDPKFLAQPTQAPLPTLPAGQGEQ